MSAQYAYVMKNMTKTFPGAQKPVLSNINLQFYQGAKIGIVGPNGAGKSTLIKIMAGIDKDYTGEAWAGGGSGGALSFGVSFPRPNRLTSPGEIQDRLFLTTATTLPSAISRASSPGLLPSFSAASVSERNPSTPRSFAS